MDIAQFRTRPPCLGWLVASLSCASTVAWTINTPPTLLFQRHASNTYSEASWLTSRQSPWVSSSSIKAAEDGGGVSQTESMETDASIDVESLVEMDCFIYSRKDSKGSKKLELGVLEERVIQPICAWTTEEAFDDYLEFVVDENDRYSLDENDVVIHSLIPSDSLSYGSRQVGGGKGPGNPHGEESELLYYIRREALEGVEVTIKPELEITW